MSPPRGYARRVARARRRMTPEHRIAHDLIIFERLNLQEAMQRTGLSEQKFLKLWTAAFHIHIAEVEAKRPWWRWW